LHAWNKSTWDLIRSTKHTVGKGDGCAWYEGDNDDWGGWGGKACADNRGEPMGPIRGEIN